MHFGYLSFNIYDVYNAKSFIRYFKNSIYLFVSYLKIPVKEPFPCSPCGVLSALVISVLR